MLPRLAFYCLKIEGKAMQYFSCVNCSWNSKMHPDSSSSIIHVLSGHSLKCRFRILEYWFSSSPSLIHRFMISSFRGQYSIIKSSVSATIAYWSLYLSCIHFLNVLFLSDCVMRCLVSFYYEECLWFHFITTNLDSSLNILGFAFFIRGVVLCFECLINIGMLAFVGFVAGIVFRAVSLQYVACCLSSVLTIFLFGPWVIRCAHLPGFFAQVCQKAISHCCWCVGSLISLCHHGRLDYYRGLCFGLIYAFSGLTFLSLPWLHRLLLNQMAASHSCQVDLSQNLSLILLGCWGLFLVAFRCVLPVPLLRLLYLNRSENGGSYRLHRPEPWLRFR